MNEQEPFNPEKYVKIYRNTYAKRIDNLSKALEDRIRSAMNKPHVFQILEAIDSLSEDIEGTRVLRRYGLGSDAGNREICGGSHKVSFSGNYDNIAEILKDFREQSGLTRTDVSRLSGISIRAVNYHEDGVHSPTRKILRKYLDIYCVDPPEAVEEIEKMLE